MISISTPSDLAELRAMVEEQHASARRWAEGEAANEKLREAAMSGSLAQVERWLAQGADPRSRDAKTGGDALMRALRHADASIVKRLLPLSDLSPQKETGCTHLMIAASWGAVASVELLLPGSDPLAVDNKGASALMAAAACAGDFDDPDRLACLRALLPVSDAKARDNQGRSALMLAVSGDGVKAARLLLPESDLGAEDDEGRTAMDLAMDARRAPCVRELKGFFDPAQKNSAGVSLARRVEAFGDAARSQEFGVMDALSDWAPFEAQKRWVDKHGAKKLPETAARLERQALEAVVGAAREASAAARGAENGAISPEGGLRRPRSL